jgi:hypothetical protein
MNFLADSLSCLTLMLSSKANPIFDVEDRIFDQSNVV